MGQLENKHNPEQERIERMSKDFHGIFDEQTFNAEAVSSLFKKIIDSYQAEGRVYHNLEHIEHLLSFIKNKESDIKDWKAMQLATWLHDVIYDTKAKDNEEQSAQYARLELEKLNIPNEAIEHTEELIRATATHQAIEGNNDSAIFLDGDLSILGVNDDEYEKYAAKIREEYSWVPEEQYNAGRKQILESFIARQRIYYTEDAHIALEAQARRNIQKEIERLV